MSSSIISVESLSKSYLVGHEGPKERYTALRDVVARTAKNFARKTLEMVRGQQIIQGDSVEEFWALKDVSFEVKQGEVLGIIGRNGAGKSTLLKILSRITEPTEGRVTIKGRVASLLEVGTGFHPEMTGRENIYLNGAILGMRRAEIKRKFDEIVAFAEVEKFLDTPVKRYSSGMYVRLAFAVAAHLEPEILIVDEVLAVGDTEFQKKCLAKMQTVGREGRTVLFVSHNLGAMARLCEQGILLIGGQLARHGPMESVITAYLSKGNRQSCVNLENADGRRECKVSRIVKAELDSADIPGTTVVMGAPLRVVCEVHLNRPLQSPVFGMQISNFAGQELLDLRSSYAKQPIGPLSAGRHRLALEVECFPLYPGEYNVGLWFAQSNLEGADDWIYSVFCLAVIQGEIPAERVRPEYGICFTKCKCYSMSGST
jgi:lipopolysaccharide transport system ATP-binding protein